MLFFQEHGTSSSAETSGLETQNEELAVAVEETTPEAPQRKKARRDPKSASAGAQGENNAMLLQAFDILKSSATIPTDPYFTYGQHIANELRKYDPNTLAHVKQAINNVIFEADMGKFSYGYYTQNYNKSTPNPTPSPASVQSTSSATTYQSQEENQETEAVGATTLQEAIEYFSSNIQYKDSVKIGTATNSVIDSCH